MSTPTYEHAGGFVLRTPLLPFAVLEDLLGSLRSAASACDHEEGGGGIVDRAALSDAIEDDHRTLAARLEHLLASNPVMREAILIASPSLDERITEWLDRDASGKTGETGEADESGNRALVRSVLAYVSRMTTRSTPFGLFAGCSTGTIGAAATSLRLPPHTEARRHTRLDFGFLTGALQQLEQDPRIQATLRFRPNSGLYRAGGRLRLAETRVDRGGVRYQRVTFDEDDALRAVLEVARSGATLADLAAVLTADGDITVEDAKDYVAELVDAQLLVSDLGPAITGDEPVPALVQQLRATEAGSLAGACLDEAQRIIERLDGDRLGTHVDAYRAIADGLRKLEPDLEPSKLLQVDMIRPAPELTLDERCADELLRAVDLLHHISPIRKRDDDVARFRDEFLSRYEGREVPLLEALDEEVGIGFGAPAGVAADNGEAGAGHPGKGNGATSPDPASAYRLRLLARALSSGSTTIVLTDDDIAALTNPAPPDLPDAIALSCTIASPSADAVRAGDFKILLQGAFGPSGARMFGRFCHADPDMDALARRHLRDEERCRPDACFAEVVHLAEGRIGNVLARPVLREYEIEFHGRSGAADEAKLALDDLLVSVSDNRVVVRSRRLDREVVPRLTSAHYFPNSVLAPYRFLGALQHQDVAGSLSWLWGALENAAFLPRVEYGRLVLSRARWTLTRADLAAVIDSRTSVDRFVAVQAVRREHRVPRWLAIAAGDKELTVDLTTAAGCDAFAHEARQAGMVLAFELFPDREGLCVETPDGMLCHELIVPLTRRAARQRATPAAVDTPVRTRSRPDATAEPTAAIEELFPPGSEWLTAKLYTGKGTADAVLRDMVAPLLARLEDSGLVDCWHFIRFADPDWHLRLRLHGDPATITGKVLPVLGHAVRPLLDDGRVWRYQLDTYRRETARYGGPEAIPLAEAVFRADSDAVSSILLALPPDDDGDARWQLAILGVDRLLADLELSTPERRAAVCRWRDALATEHGSRARAGRQHAGQVMRREGNHLTALLDGSISPGLLASAARAFDDRSTALRPVVAELRALEAAGRLRQELLSIAFSYSHLHVNRLLRASQRLQEFLVYDLLDRLYNRRLHQKGPS